LVYQTKNVDLFINLAETKSVANISWTKQLAKQFKQFNKSLSPNLLLVFQVAEGPCLSNNSGLEVDQSKPVEVLAATFQHLKERSKPFEGQDDVEEQVKN
jgi:hypothetical protein